jgi:hypothetical protein
MTVIRALRALAKAEAYLAGVDAALAAPVTDSEYPRSGLFNSRNNAVGPGPWVNYSHEPAPCHLCQHRFDDNETVFIAKQPYKPGHSIWRRFPLCESCAKQQLPANGWHSFYPPKPCGYCERKIAVSCGASARRRPDFCCDLCASREVSRVSKDIRKRMRKKRCQQCEKDFEGTRADARFCSSACRQQAYRVRAEPATPCSHLAAGVT